MTPQLPARATSSLVFRSATHRRLKGFPIDVDISQNIVSSNGAVGTDDVRKQAERIARSVDGVKDVKNNLSIK